ncbi:membrane protein [Marinobacterium zhoushanense]|uniref:Membrane protein n=1 Tax=Marinobacterium zhoushanense TaxID=1679163 RepID=A0ABQ1K962_9GAMM|nr:metal-dependent hydrolase [Marinobacterium zhoushanense]GGB91576.1 membrane protein [Marinobacterium zhoushanense]
MANFNTHFLGGAVTSCVLTSTMLLTGLFTPGQGMSLWVAGTVASLAPDLDSDTTGILKGLFSALGVMASFGVLFRFPNLPLLHLWGAMLAAFLLVRFGLLQIFAHLTEHRGAFHSLMAAVSIGLLSTLLCWRFTSQGIDFSWALGGMVFAGYLVHLILDECYAVDLSDMEFKRSFGSALKPISIDNWWASGIFLAIAIYCATQLPLPHKLPNEVVKIASTGFV